MNGKAIVSFLKNNESELAALEGNLIAAQSGKILQNILITSCHKGAGKTTTAIAFAYTLATKAHARVLLVEGNFKFPALHQHFSLDKASGITDLIVEEDDESKIHIHKTDHPRLSVMPIGLQTKGLTLLTLDNLLKKWDMLKNSFDYILMDGTSILDASDAIRFLPLFHAVLLVVECERTTSTHVQQANEKVASMGNNIAGVILNKKKRYVPRFLMR